MILPTVKVLTSKNRRGVLPRLLSDLLAEENRMKEEHEKESDLFRKETLKSREMALKVLERSISSEDIHLMPVYMLFRLALIQSMDF